MADNDVTDYPRPLHPLHAILLAFPPPLFLGALLSDLAYSSTYEVQWTNFASWLIAGAMLAGALATLWALIECAVSGRQRTGKHFAYVIALLAMLGVGFINALVHTKDGWAAMPAGLWLSVIVTVLALIASWIGYAGLRAREVAHAR
ncbi:hypothetical protein LL252_17880 [Alcanivorax marinus]|uniref:DUF2231 domain-containing protein n=1 Tax=Alloalcanivorax marinus TaxID=1177169 RepID=A0A9Q3YPZ2_9GAMM|nr:DUF2231 domain-containing protein [Alloalcanivorax marinus]MCC4310441.1 hypothetical protein [Alloalcanivorax marinus]MCU5785560.1 hypothetical protein [Alloalcanivorax marinus]